MFSRWRSGLPLFGKELTEQAARPRTYLVRIVYVSLLSILIMNTLAKEMRFTSPLVVLGQGLPILKSLVHWEFFGIYLFLPAMACGVLTTEKERNTLPLLFLTRLGPWTIIWEKLLSRLFPMLMFLCCALPVMAMTYSMGGLTSFQLFVSAWFLVLAAFQTACVAVMCSALTNSTSKAFLQTYFVLWLLAMVFPFLLFMFVPASAQAQFADWVFATPALNWGRNTNPGMRWTGYGLYSYGLNYTILPGSLSLARIYDDFMGGPWFGARTTPWYPAVMVGIPSLVSGLCCLIIARWALYRRAFVVSSNPLLKLFRGLDRVYFWAHRKFSFDVKLVREADSLPNFDPIAWREVSKRSLGQFRYLVRIMIPLLFPVIFVGIFIATSSASDWRSGSDSVRLTPLVLFLAGVNLVLILATGSNAIPLERTRQTWDVLRSMPMTARDILQQKLCGVRRLQWVCGVPVFCAIGLQAWWRYQLQQVGLTNRQPGVRFADDNFLWWEYLIGACIAFWLYAEQVKWISLWSGLMSKNSIRAIFVSGLMVAAVATVPYFLVFYAAALLVWLIPELIELRVLFVNTVLASFPISFIWMNEFEDLRHLWSVPLTPAAIHLVCQSLVLYAIRRHILNNAEWYLGRIGNSSKSQPASQAASSREHVPREPPSGRVAEVA